MICDKCYGCTAQEQPNLKEKESCSSFIDATKKEKELKYDQLGMTYYSTYITCRPKSEEENNS